MRADPVRLDLMTRRERHAALDAAAAAVGGAGGWVEDITFYSNLLASVRATLPARGASELRAQLLGAGFSLTDAGRAALAEAASLAPGTEVRCVIQLNFIHDEPDLRRTVLAVPG